MRQLKIQEVKNHRIQFFKTKILAFFNIYSLKLFQYSMHIYFKMFNTSHKILSTFKDTKFLKANNFNFKFLQFRVIFSLCCNRNQSRKLLGYACSWAMYHFEEEYKTIRFISDKSCCGFFFVAIFSENSRFWCRFDL